MEVEVEWVEWRFEFERCRGGDGFVRHGLEMCERRKSSDYRQRILISKELSRIEAGLFNIYSVGILFHRFELDKFVIEIVSRKTIMF